MIEIKNLTKSFENVTPIRNVSVTINDGDVVAIIGPSGCGKSTFLNMMNLITTPTSGQIFLDGEEITAPGYNREEVNKKLGMVFQHFNLFGHLTALENVMIPQIDVLGKSRKEAYDRAMELLHMVGMDGRAMQYPNKLSGGQKQRVAIARTLALNPKVLLFDEPTSALDPTMVGEVQAVIKNLAQQGTTMMIVTHEMKLAREVSNRVFYMDEGGIYEDASPEQIFEHPQKPLTKRFIEHIKVLEITIGEKDFDFIGSTTEIEQYGNKNQLDRKTIIALVSVFEELCQQILLRHNPGCEIRFVVEYSEKNNNLAIDVRYNGDLFNPVDTDNEISLAILKNRVSEMKYSISKEDAYCNHIQMKLKG